MEMSKDELISTISNQSRYGEELDKCLTKYNCKNTQEITEEQLQEYIVSQHLEVTK